MPKKQVAKKIRRALQLYPRNCSTRVESDAGQNVANKVFENLNFEEEFLKRSGTIGNTCRMVSHILQSIQ